MNEQIERMIAKDKPLSAIKLVLKQAIEEENKAQFNSEMLTKYTALFTVTESYVETEINDIGEEVEITKEREVIPEGTVSFTDWLNETVIVTEGVEEVRDEDGMMITPAVEEATELVRPYVPLTADELEARATKYLAPFINKNKITEAKSYLSKTDWIIAKIAEANVTGGDVTPLTQQYADELVKREEARTTINELES
ncbi:hypothetical protein EBI00_02520 [Marinomonas hwangdonensis]|uniref:Uncharacterized protein n=1 Tax=Marinomonas hwangdonensis TaxID=1053647 RepID=A0A3M8QDD5_9GAMM|nr:hypothetical protein [Marinomonas hwangdonensis]RNF52994.1 hypothetical protein EBI00_02520 [Marinomonas hwangdonensis]